MTKQAIQIVDQEQETEEVLSLLEGTMLTSEDLADTLMTLQWQGNPHVLQFLREAISFKTQGYIEVKEHPEYIGA